ncbi:MAG: Lrp/AsnC ligand binding domain-containing protein [Planctomycetales bacterium]|nr:Lrp/AsnC ligand binding domain-containing protein [Planctomycetales bacterium]
MGTSALILAEMRLPMASGTSRRLRGLEGVRIAESVAGRFDLAVLAEEETPPALDEAVLSQVQRTPGFARSSTLFAVREALWRPRSVRSAAPWRGFLLARATAAGTRRALTALARTRGVAWAAALTGEFDLGSYLVADGADDFGKILLRVRGIPGIVSTETFVATE